MSATAYFFFSGLVGAETLYFFKSNFVERMNDPLRMRPFTDAVILFNSMGGTAEHGLALHEFLNRYPARITVVNVGAVCSAGAVAFLAIPRERRLMAAHAVFMVHHVFLGIEGHATRAEMAALMTKMDAQNTQVRDIVCGNTHLTPSQWEQYGNNEQWFPADLALGAGFVSAVGTFTLPRDSVFITDLHRPFIRRPVI